MRVRYLCGLLVWGLTSLGCSDEVDAGEFCERAQKSISDLVEKSRPCLSDLDERALEEKLQDVLPAEDACVAHVEAQCSQEDRKAALTLADCVDALPRCSPIAGLSFAEDAQACLDTARTSVRSECLSL